MLKTSVSLLDLNVEKKMGMLLKHCGGKGHFTAVDDIFQISGRN